MKKEIIAIPDSDWYQMGNSFRRDYEGKSDWIAKTIETMAKQGYILQQRLPDECMIFRLDKKLLESIPIS